MRGGERTGKRASGKRQNYRTEENVRVARVKRDGKGERRGAKDIFKRRSGAEKESKRRQVNEE